ncbi:barstar family protein [Nocardia sp. alder85J]|nr:barstar family protein [Nocardia sp. alder85J]
MTLARFLAAPSARIATAAAVPYDTTATPALGALAVDAGRFSGVRYRVPDGYLARELRGARMRTLAGVFDEFAAAFQFPYYFGENKDAFDECLRDLDEFVGAAAGYVALIRDSAELLADEPGELSWFAAATSDAAAYWSAKHAVYRAVLQGTPPCGDVVTLTA